MDTAVDYMAIHREVCSKIKKRFTRKANIAQKSETLGQLRSQLRRQEADAYAGLFSQALARCEQAIGNKLAECDATVAAARSFLEAEKKLRELETPSCEEFLISAISFYNQSIQMRCSQNAPQLGASLCLELATTLLEMNHVDQAISFMDRASDLLHHSPIDALLVMETSASCRLLSDDFTGCLGVLTELLQTLTEQGVYVSSESSQLLGPYRDVAARCEVLRILLLVMLQPSGQHLRSEHSQAIEKIANWDPLSASMPECSFSENLFLHLHSLVTSVQAGDATSVEELQPKIWPLLTPEHNHVVFLLLERMRRCVEEDM
eukprot:scpid91781/ scgid29917/ Factor VIII intron 22 protein; CpG island protein